MAITNVKADEKMVRLATQIQMTIQQFTMVSPMTADDVIAVMGFCIGGAIANAPQNHTVRERRQMAVANIDHGLNAFLAAPKSNLIFPV
jgi:dienelactone hydrolase